MENDRDLVEIVRDMIMNGQSRATFEFFLEDIPFIVTIGISSIEDKRVDE